MSEPVFYLPCIEFLMDKHLKRAGGPEEGNPEQRVTMH